ncbi:MAG: hypothetical protein MUO76_07075 [Anaerolineaceae bacterium]|nr:hypothetical protein [Anaerolineaceae bacterium]
MAHKSPKTIVIIFLIFIFSLFSLACEIEEWVDDILAQIALSSNQPSAEDAPVLPDPQDNPAQPDPQVDPVQSNPQDDVVIAETISWSGPPECGDEVDESANWRWRVSLMPDGMGGMVGTIHFHDCPGGGRVAYHVTLVSESEDGVLSLVGNRTGSSGALGYDDPTIPDSETFTVKIGEAPFPNYSE